MPSVRFSSSNPIETVDIDAGWQGLIHESLADSSKIRTFLARQSRHGGHGYRAIVSEPRLVTPALSLSGRQAGYITGVALVTNSATRTQKLSFSTRTSPRAISRPFT